MTSSPSFSKPSRLVELFQERSGIPDAAGEDAIRTLARRLGAASGEPGNVDVLLPIRNIVDVAIVPDLPCDGMIVPIGRSHSDGFRMSLSGAQKASRLRFTKAHEICHTFFYELVPEVKFFPHATDPTEERLCNVGAAELLMPIEMVEAEAACESVSITSLQRIAKRFKVSPAAMFLRLRELGLWHCEFASWHRMVDGSFVLARLIGGQKLNWQLDSTILHRAWDNDTGRTESGFTFVYCERGDVSAAKAVHYEIQRQGDAILTLWSRRKLMRKETLPPLFKAAKLRRGG